MSLPPNDGGDGGPAALAPGGGARPREGSRDIRGEGKIVSVPDDWCHSPVNIVPYPIWAWQSDASNLANTVRQTNDRSHAKDSIVLMCFGDEAGTGGGVISHTHNGSCWPKTWSNTVRFEGRNAVRHDDEWWMNNKNTWGRLQYSVDLADYKSSSALLIKPKISTSAVAGRAVILASADEEEDEKEKLEEIDPLIGPTPHIHTGNKAIDEKENQFLRNEERSLQTIVQQYGLRISQGNALRNAKPTGSALKDDAYHRGASFMRDQAASKGVVTEIIGADGKPYTLTQIPGEMNGTPGRFEYMVDPSGNLTHQMFVPNGTINGVPIKR